MLTFSILPRASSKVHPKRRSTPLERSQGPTGEPTHNMMRSPYNPEYSFSWRFLWQRKIANFLLEPHEELSHWPWATILTVIFFHMGSRTTGLRIKEATSSNDSCVALQQKPGAFSAVAHGMWQGSVSHINCWDTAGERRRGLPASAPPAPAEMRHLLPPVCG